MVIAMRSLRASFIGISAFVAGATVLTGTPHNQVETIPATATIPVSSGAGPDRYTACGVEGREIIVWGDSIANGVGHALKKEVMGTCASGAFNRVINLGVDSAGLEVKNPAYRLVPENIIAAAARTNSVVVINIGTNDIGYMLGNRRRMEKYADHIVDIAKNIDAKGADPVIIGMQQPLKDYGTIRGNVRAEWVDSMTFVNKKLEEHARDDGIVFVPNTNANRADDGLHYTRDGYRDIGRHAIQAAGYSL